MAFRDRIPMVRLAALSATTLALGLASPAQGQRLASPATCHLNEQAGSMKGPDVAVSVLQATHEVRTGDPIKVQWKVASAIDFKCRTALYLVIATPMRTRFEGEKFIAIPPHADGPYQISYRADQTRIFVPLHVGPEQLSGEVIVKTYKAGPFQMEWVLVEIPKFFADPRERRDLEVGGEKLTDPTSLKADITIIGGNPTIVVRDEFAIEPPKRIVRSNSNEFDLQIFDRYYRVIDVETGELLLERDGWDPNFSPSGRFLGAYSAGAGLNVVDLYSGKVVTSTDIVHRERGLNGNVHMVAWSEGDAFLALSIQFFGNIDIQQSLVDGSNRSFRGTSCHYCGGIYSALLIDAEKGIATFKNSATGWASLLNPTLSSEAAEKEALARLPRQSWESEFNERTPQQNQYVERRNQLAIELAAQALAKLGKASFFEPDELITGYDESNASALIERNWRFPGSMKLSHVCLAGDDGRCVGRLADWQDTLKEPEEINARLAKLRVEHRELAVAGSANTIDAVQAADSRLISTRGTARGVGAQNKIGVRSEVIWDRLSQLLPNAKSEAGLKSISLGVDVPNAAGDDPVRAIKESLPKAAALLKPSGPSDFVDYADISEEAYSGLKTKPRFIDPRTIRAVATWRTGDETYWLIHSFFDYGASSRHWLYLVHGSGTSSASLEDFTHRLRYRVGKKPSGLDESGQIEMTEEFATTMGFGGWPGSFDKVSLAYNRYLMATGVWTIDARRWVLMYDLKTNQIQFFNRDIPEAATLAQLAITEDGRTIVQAHSNGRLYFHDVPTGKLVLRGYDIDDELVVYDERGYYAATPEGAHFVFLKFPGLPGYNSFRQFSATLSRPDLIQRILTGQIDTPDPRLTSPPSANLNVEVAADGEKRWAKLKVAATSTTGLERVRIYIDGRIASEPPVAGRETVLDVSMDLLPQSRWITAVAVDTSGYESVPVGQDLAGASAAKTSRLFAISVGTDTYDDRRIEPLNVAKKDAESFGKMAKEIRAANYAAVEVTTFLDASNLRTDLIAKVRQVAASANEQDTIMLFAAGHGFRDPGSGEFFLATRETRIDDLGATSIAWSEMASALEGAKARVVGFIDACNSGAAASASNDDAVSAFLGRKTSITVVAASKGRQDSQEDRDVGGLFTTALIRSVTRDRLETDTNGNGIIELAELYASVKRRVLLSTDGQQTPWIARNLMVGEIPLF